MSDIIKQWLEEVGLPPSRAIEEVYLGPIRHIETAFDGAP